MWFSGMVLDPGGVGGLCNAVIPRKTDSVDLRYPFAPVRVKEWLETEYILTIVLLAVDPVGCDPVVQK